MDGTYSNIVLSGLQHVDGQENPAALSEDAYILIRSEIATFGTPAANGTTPASLLEITAPHVMKTGKSPIPCFTMMEKSDFESALTGEVYSKLFMPTATLFLPQPTSENAGNISVIKNCRLILLIKRTGDQYFTQIGTQDLSAKVKEGSVKYGKGPTGEPGITFQVEAPSIHPFYLYKGALPVTGV